MNGLHILLSQIPDSDFIWFRTINTCFFGDCADTCMLLSRDDINQIYCERFIMSENMLISQPLPNISGWGKVKVTLNLLIFRDHEHPRTFNQKLSSQGFSFTSLESVWVRTPWGVVRKEGAARYLPKDKESFKITFYYKKIYIKAVVPLCCLLLLSHVCIIELKYTWWLWYHHRGLKCWKPKLLLQMRTISEQSDLVTVYNELVLCVSGLSVKKWGNA